MKIGFLGNANNYPFMLARALRRAGHDVLFVLNRKASLDRPDHRYEDVDIAASDWIVDAGELEDTERHQFLPDSALREEVIARLRLCDAVILNHAALSLASLIGRPHLALLTGTDIQQLADRGYEFSEDTRTAADRLWLGNAISRQRSAIASAVAVSVFFRGLIPRHDAALDGLGVASGRRFFCWMTDPHYIHPKAPPQGERVRIFNLARLTWKRVGEGDFTEDHKASDVMIRGLAEFCRRHPGARLDIRLAEKGQQVAEAKKLVEASGLSPHVTWLKELTQREALEEYRRADIVFDQLGLSVVAMGGLDAMAVGRPLIANARPDVLRHFVPLPPICQAATVEEAVVQLERLVLSREERERVGRESRAYVEQNCTADAAARMCVDRLEAVVSNPTRYSLWSQQSMESRERLTEERDARLSQAETHLAERETRVMQIEARLAEVTSRESAALVRENLLARREELAAERAAEHEAEAARLFRLQTQLAQERSELARSFAAYDALRIVRWQRAIKAWIQRLSGRTGEKST